MTLNPGVTPLVGSAREGQAGPDPTSGVPPGVAERPVVPWTPGNSGRGKGPRFKANAQSNRQPGDWHAPTTSSEGWEVADGVAHTKAKNSPDYRFYALYDKVYRRDVLEWAFVRCLRNGGVPGVNGQSFDDIEKLGRDQWLDELAAELRNGTYQPRPVRRVYIPKGDGKQRPLGIPCIRDRVVQTATMLVLEPIFEADLEPEQHAYRPERSALNAAPWMPFAKSSGCSGRGIPRWWTRTYPDISTVSPMPSS